MKILIIEDLKEKAIEIEELVNAVLARPSVHHVLSYHSGLDEIEEFEPDLIVLDMSMHSYDGVDGRNQGRWRPTGGLDLLDALEDCSGSPLVIVVTQHREFKSDDGVLSYEAIMAECSKSYPKNFRGGVLYLLNEEAWKELLAEKLLCCARELTEAGAA